MITDKIKELEQLRNQAAALEKRIEEEKAAKLASMHAEVGLESTEALISALRGLAKKPRRAKQPPKRRKRVRLTPAQKENIAKEIKGGLKGTEAAKKFGVSLPTIQKIKKDFGLVKSRAKKSA